MTTFFASIECSFSISSRVIRFFTLPLLTPYEFVMHDVLHWSRSGFTRLEATTNIAPPGGMSVADVYRSSRKQIRHICNSSRGNWESRELGLCFHWRKTLFIRRIDFSFQNFPNRHKKNNQLDRVATRKYFAKQLTSDSGRQ